MAARVALLLGTLGLALFLTSAHVQDWERENGFPFGRYCEVWSQCQ